MNTRKFAPLAFAVILATGAASTAALAKGGHEESQDAAALANAKVTLSQAIATAEQQAGGKAISAGVDNENGTVRIAVDVASNQGVKTVLVDPQTGQATGTKPAGDGDHEEAD